MIARRTFLASAAALAAPFARAARGPVYYVAPEGDDAASGSKDKPWATVERAVERLIPGDTLLIRAGTYTPQRRIVVRTPNPEGRLITIAGYPGELPVLDFGKRNLPPATTSGWIMRDHGVFLLLETAHVGVANLKLINAAGGGAAGIMALRSSHVTIENCVTWDTASSGISAWRSDHVTVAHNNVGLACNGGANECMSLASVDTFEVHHNEIHSTTEASSTRGGEGIDIKEASKNGKAYRNYVHDLGRLGIYTDGFYSPLQDVEIYENRVTRCAFGHCVGSEGGTLVERVRIHHNLYYGNRGTGIAVWEWETGSKGPRRDLYIYNNTVYGNGQPGARLSGGIYITAKDIRNLNVFNNIFCKNSHYEMAISTQDPVRDNLVFEYNLVDTRKSVPEGSPQKVLYGEALTVGDPLFMAPEKGDFRLRGGSPAINAAKPGTQYSDPDGSRGDLGAIPFGKTFPLE